MKTRVIQSELHRARIAERRLRDRRPSAGPAADAAPRSGGARAHPAAPAARVLRARVRADVDDGPARRVHGRGAVGRRAHRDRRHRRSRRPARARRAAWCAGASACGGTRRRSSSRSGVALATGGLNVALGASDAAFAKLELSALVMLFAMRLVVPVFAPIGEEPGWRGFALPRLQAEHSPFVSTLDPRGGRGRSGTCR